MHYNNISRLTRYFRCCTRLSVLFDMREFSIPKRTIRVGIDDAPAVPMHGAVRRRAIFAGTRLTFSRKWLAGLDLI